MTHCDTERGRASCQMEFSFRSPYSDYGAAYAEVNRTIAGMA